MALSIDQIRAVKEDFKNDFFFKDPYNKYMNLVGISTLKMAGMDKKDLKKGESLDDYCITVGLRTDLPKGLSVPDVYQSSRVFYDIRGEITAYEE
ncbi:MAG: hypothetical protein ABIB71_09360 [Candidatus Woesearchaeota archaeon]